MVAGCNTPKGYPAIYHGARGCWKCVEEFFNSSQSTEDCVGANGLFSKAGEQSGLVCLGRSVSHLAGTGVGSIHLQSLGQSAE